MTYLVKTPWLLKKVYSSYIWEMDKNVKKIYLTFDDGPHPEATVYVLDQLRDFNAKATFFCIGKNVVLYPDLYNRISEEHHTIGNHTYDHLNGWTTPDDLYLQNIEMASKEIASGLFRPPYGRLKRSQALKLKDTEMKVVMWSVLSGDFDSITPEVCARNVIKNTTGGSIVVFHDSEKAFPKMRYALPLVLEYFSKLGYSFEAIRF